ERRRRPVPGEQAGDERRGEAVAAAHSVDHLYAVPPALRERAGLRVVQHGAPAVLPRPEELAPRERDALRLEARRELLGESPRTPGPPGRTPRACPAHPRRARRSRAPGARRRPPARSIGCPRLPFSVPRPRRPRGDCRERG